MIASRLSVGPGLVRQTHSVCSRVQSQRSARSKLTYAFRNVFAFADSVGAISAKAQSKTAAFADVVHLEPMKLPLKTQAALKLMVKGRTLCADLKRRVSKVMSPMGLSSSDLRVLDIIEDSSDFFSNSSEK